MDHIKEITSAGRFEMTRDGRALYTLTGERALLTAPNGAAALLRRAFREGTGCELPAEDDTCPRRITLSVSGGLWDWSVDVDGETGNVTLTGGSAPYLERAAQRFCAVVFTGKAVPAAAAGSCRYSGENGDFLDNSGLLKYVPADRESLRPSSLSGELLSPSWLDKAVIAEVKVDTAAPGLTFADARRIVDHYAACGVNCLWLPPVYRRGEGGNGYGNIGPHTAEPLLTGKKDDREGFAEIRRFVDYAHSRGIYILLDIVTWGAMKSAPLRASHPDWFDGEAWGNAAFNWKNPAFREWFIDVCTENLLVTDADGYRCDCEPNYAGYDVFGEIRRRLEERGKFPVLMSEDGCDRSRTFDLEQDGVLDYARTDRAGYFFRDRINFFADGLLDIVQSSKDGTGLGSVGEQKKPEGRGRAKYYTNAVCNHDFEYRIVCGDRLRLGYAAILAPYIPLWYMGDEFNASNEDGTLYFKPVDFSEADEPDKRLFFEDVKSLLRLRREMPGLFEVWPRDHRDCNICRVTAQGFGTLPAYARTAPGRAVLVVPNDGKSGSCLGHVTVPAEALNAVGKPFVITDLFTDCELFSGLTKDVTAFDAFVPPRYMGLYLVRGE